ncbi:MAG: ABC transporter ATP-binding protein [Candidatus Nezhaarchaeales archaeon]
MLEVREVDVFRGPIQILWKVSIEVNKGEVVSLIGPNGAGKTTLINAIVGLLKPSSGTIKFNGIDITRLPPHKVVDVGIALVPEDRKLFGRMTVRENLLLGAYAARGKKTKEEMFKTVCELFPILKERERQLAMTLSGGEQRMLTIARGLMSNPELLILDEPTQGLSPKMALEIFKTVEKLKGRGISILLAEQNVYHALSLADRAYVLETGRVMLQGKGKELLENDYVKKAYLGL